MHVEFDCPDHAAVIERILEGFIQAGELLIRAGAVEWRPPLDIVLQDDDVQRFQLPTETDQKKTADCEDLIIWWAAGLRATGRDPRARARIKNTGPMKVHCCLLRGDGSVHDVYQEHLDEQAKRGYELGGFWSAIKGAAKSVGRAAESVGHGVATAGRAVGHAAQYVAKDLPKAVLHEAGSGLKSVAGGVADFAKDVGEAGSGVVNALGDVVAHGAQDAIHQVGKLVGGVGSSFSGGFGDDYQPAPEAQQAPQGDAGPGGEGFGGMQGFEGGQEQYDGPDPFGDTDIGEEWSGDDMQNAADEFYAEDNQ